MTMFHEPPAGPGAPSRPRGAKGSSNRGSALPPEWLPGSSGCRSAPARHAGGAARESSPREAYRASRTRRTKFRTRSSLAPAPPSGPPSTLASNRTAPAPWTSNKERIARLLAAGLMAPAGHAAVEAARRSGAWAALDAVVRLEIPEDLEARLARAAAAARANFDAFPRSAKRAILEWIRAAQKAETRAGRIAETVTQAARSVRANQWRR